ncbi:MAG: hypothetical protein F9K40_03280 [Kofleriaceae bacterium]|nr:MAG: hypothetical protein F9K40_03280 [Kofleriaceae bacterium]
MRRRTTPPTPPAVDFDPKGPSPDGALLKPIDPIDAFYKEAQAAIARGDDEVEVTTEAEEFAEVMQRAIRIGGPAVAEVQRLAHANRGRVPELVDPIADASDGIPLDGPLGEIDTARLRRMSRASLLCVVERLLRDRDEERDAIGSPETLSDDELRATARDLWPAPVHGVTTPRA